MTAPRTRPLAHSRVLVVGAGGLGHPAALALLRAEVGHVGLVDGDRVEPSNLPRQILFSAADIGRLKVEAAADALRKRFPAAVITSIASHLTAEAAATIFPTYDFVIDATDRTSAKFLVHDAAVRARVPLSHAGVVGDRGQTMTILPGRSCCLRCLFPEAPADDEMPTCEQAGVLGPFVGLFGTLQAAEAVKYLSSTGALLTDRLLTIGNGHWREVRLRRDSACTLCSAHGA